MAFFSFAYLKFVFSKTRRRPPVYGMFFTCFWVVLS